MVKFNNFTVIVLSPSVMNNPVLSMCVSKETVKMKPVLSNNQSIAFASTTFPRAEESFQVHC